MALSRFVLPFADVGSGIRPSSGAKLLFSETGTNIPKDTFNCPHGTTANSNPVIADSTGVFPDIFMIGIYKVILLDKNDAQQWEADPVESFSDLNAVARALNVLDSDIIYDTDTVTAIPAYIYSASQQKTYSVPADAQGKFISSVVSDVLYTTVGGPYKLKAPAFSIANRGYVELYGASETASASENVAAYNAAITYCKTTGETLKSLSGRIHTVDESINIRSVRHVDLKAQINGNGEFVTVLMGGDSNNTQQYYDQSVYKVNKGGTLPAIRIVGSSKNKISIGEASVIEVYADTTVALGGTDEYCAYNKIYIQSCTTLQINSNAATDGSVVQWINENQFYLSYCLYFKMFDNGYQHNSNQFWGGNFEAGDSTIEFETGIANTFWNVRGESALAVTFSVNSANNTVLTDWIGSANNPASAASITNNGLNNCVKNTADLYNDRILMAGFNGSTLVVNGTITNLLGFNYFVAFDNALNTVTASANQLLYTSQLIQISPNNQYFHVILEDKLSGGIRMEIDAYDSAMSAISSTGDDVLYPGATNEDAGFGENSTTITNSLGTRRIHIKNTNAKWIRLTVKASSAGVSFRRFEFSAITSDKDGKSELMTSAMVSGL